MRRTACVGLGVLTGTMAVMASASGQIGGWGFAQFDDGKPTRRCTRHALHVTRRLKIETSSLLVTRAEGRPR